jgi:hypothetical protein
VEIIIGLLFMCSVPVAFFTGALSLVALALYWREEQWQSLRERLRPFLWARGLEFSEHSEPLTQDEALQTLAARLPEFLRELESSPEDGESESTPMEREPSWRPPESTSQSGGASLATSSA